MTARQNWRTNPPENKLFTNTGPWKCFLYPPISHKLDIYRIMLSDKKYGLSVNMMATRVMPSLLPQTVNPSLNLEQFMILLEVSRSVPRFSALTAAISHTQVLQEMLDCIDRQQRNKLKLDNLSLPSPERHRPLRHQFSSDNMHVPPFNIPNLRIDQRKTSSAEDMARKNSTGSISNDFIFALFAPPHHGLALQP